MASDPTERRPRSPGLSVQQIFALDRRPPPDLFREGDVDFVGTGELAFDAYLSADFHRREVEKVWMRCWQMATRSERLRRPGTQVVYDIAGRSVVIVRDREQRLRAFVNSCPHRGTRLVDADSRSQRIRCPFHALTWTLDGRIDKWPCAWDFSHVEPERFALREVRTGEWNGFVFVNFDPDAPPLDRYLEDLPRHFERWPLDERYTAAHVGRVLACNWKIALEAFLETFHVVGIHPEALPYFGDANSQYDVWQGRRHFSRMINPSGVISPHLSVEPDPVRTLAAAASTGICPGHALAAGETPRQRIADHVRALHRERAGVEFDHYADSDLVDVIEYNLFPNLVLFGGFASPLAYRARPLGDDPGQCLFEVWMLLPFAKGSEPPEPAPFRMLGPRENFSSVPELTFYGPVLDQDADAMPLVQRGMRASLKGTATLSRYQEIRIRHMRRTLAEYLAS
jgi:nitrite reductase/ring-hydroxylating ferredoxin subunit